MLKEDFFEQHFLWWVGLCCGIYLGLEFMYIAKLPLVMDEFQGAQAVYRLLEDVPYVDFRPYKTVLGYYLQLPPMLLSDDPWQQIMHVKQAMAVLTALSIFFAARMLSRHYSATAIVVATLMLVMMSTFLERSAAFRVDMLTGLFGLFSLLLLLDRRLVLSGVLAGLSFLISQKGIYFILCGGFALGVLWCVQTRTREAFFDCLRFTAAVLAPVAVYFAFWGAVASAGSVAHEVLVKNQYIVFEPLYAIRHFWFQTLLRNPLFWGLALLGLGQLAFFRDEESDTLERDRLLLAYGVGLLGLGLWHKQPWPYFFVLLIPTAWILVAGFAHRFIGKMGGVPSFALLALVLLGVAFPMRRIPVVLDRDNASQRVSVSVANSLLEEGEGYFAGVSMLHARPQTPADFGWLDARRLDRVAAKDPRQTIAKFEANPPKLLITNYRIRKLPSPVLDYLAAHYAPYTGNILLYAPVIAPGEGLDELRFAGNYVIGGPAGATLEIDGRRFETGQRIWVERGSHTFKSEQPLRLHLTPEEDLRPTDLRLASKSILFGNVYGY